VTTTLLVDGDNLFKIGFHGVRELYNESKHIGGLFHFINTLRKHILENEFDKVIVFWDGKNNSQRRKDIFPEYKQNRKQTLNEYQKESFDWQRQRVKLYLEELFIRQIMIDGCESDDLIAYYCHISEDEFKTIFSSDKDLTQLISEQVSVYSPIKRQLYKNGDKIDIDDLEIPHENIVVYKTIMGDKSDNIDGIHFLGAKTLVKFFPEILSEKIDINFVKEKTKELAKNITSTAVTNLLEGKTKRGVIGDFFWERNVKLVDLSVPLLSDENKSEVNDYYREDLDPEGRGYKNLIRLMIEDGIFKYLPKQDEQWVEFVNPFMKLTRKEKRRFIKNQ
jgi:5'-3' exonuclease